MAKPIHAMIRVLNEASAVDFYKRAFGLEIASRLAFDGFTLVYFLVAAFFLPETKGKTLEEIEAHFEGKATA